MQYYNLRLENTVFKRQMVALAIQTEQDWYLFLVAETGDLSL